MSCTIEIAAPINTPRSRSKVSTPAKIYGKLLPPELGSILLIPDITHGADQFGHALANLIA